MGSSSTLVYPQQECGVIEPGLYNKRYRYFLINPTLICRCTCTLLAILDMLLLLSLFVCFQLGFTYPISDVHIPRESPSSSKEIFRFQSISPLKHKDKSLNKRHSNRTPIRELLDLDVIETAIQTSDGDQQRRPDPQKTLFARATGPPPGFSRVLNPLERITGTHELENSTMPSSRPMSTSLPVPIPLPIPISAPGLSPESDIPISRLGRFEGAYGAIAVPDQPVRPIPLPIASPPPVSRPIPIPIDVLLPRPIPSGLISMLPRPILLPPRPVPTPTNPNSLSPSHSPRRLYHAQPIRDLQSPSGPLLLPKTIGPPPLESIATSNIELRVVRNTNQIILFLFGDGKNGYKFVTGVRYSLNSHHLLPAGIEQAQTIGTLQTALIVFPRDPLSTIPIYPNMLGAYIQHLLPEGVLVHFFDYEDEGRQSSEDSVEMRDFVIGVHRDTGMVTRTYDGDRTLSLELPPPGRSSNLAATSSEMTS